jgi:hypothetical protein
MARANKYNDVPTRWPLSMILESLLRALHCKGWATSEERKGQTACDACEAW